jgi:hypothetical protein
MRGRHATSLRSNSYDIAVYSPRCAPAQPRRFTMKRASWTQGPQTRARHHAFCKHRSLASRPPYQELIW